MIDAHFKIGCALRDAVPILVVIQATQEELLAVKRTLIERRHTINDGYEHVGFQPWAFNNRPIINVKSTRTGRATDTIAAASYELRLVGHDTYLANDQSIDAPDTVILTGGVNEIPFESSPHTSVYHITEISSLDDLAFVLVKE
jgi:hypothetical protein